jgi:APA family basic amino acid/polyamine antiporter
MEKKKGLSPFDFFTIGFGAIVGVGWAVSINNWMANAGGPLPAAIGYVLSLIFMVPIALAYAELTPALPVAGGGVAFAYKVFGQRIAFISGWASVGAFITIIPWEAIYINNILVMLFPALETGDPLYQVVGVDIYPKAIIVGIVFSLIVFLLNWFGAKSSAGFQKIMCILLLSAAFIAIIASLLKADTANLQPIYENVGRGNHKSFWGGAISILAMSPFFLSGFETIPQGIEDSDGDVKNVGKTVVAAVGLACIFYAILLFALGLALPWQEFYQLKTPAASNLFTIIYDGSVGQVLWTIILVGALAGLFTTWNAFMMATPRLMMGLARASLLPKFFARQNKSGSPSVALIFCGIFSAIGPMVGIGVIDPLTSFSAAAFVLSWFITVISLIRLRKTQPDLHRPYKVPNLAIVWLGVIMAAVIFILFLIPGSICYISDLGLTLFICWMSLGLILYLVTIPARNRIPEAERTATLYSHMGSED